MYTLKPLTFKYNDLEPIIDARTIEIHYTKHHQNYLNKLNELLIKNNYDFKDEPKDLVNKIDIFPIKDRGNILYNLGGHLNHTLYWDSISDKNHIPSGKILELINNKYGSFNKFKDDFIKKAGYLKGSGYTFLVLDKQNNLDIINLPNQETPYSYNFKPILALDLWEHAYYLKYQNERDKYINNFFSIIDFKKINENYQKEIQ